MRELQQRIIQEMGVKPQIDPAAEVADRVRFLKDYLTSTGARGYVLGISGGLDSTIAGRLCELAAEELRAEGRDAVFVPVRLPYNVQHDEDDAQAALDFIDGEDEITYDIAPAVDGFESEYAAAVDEPISDFNKGNVKARVRMVAQYAIAGAQSMLVVGTDHGAESVTGFFTKYGDGAADVLPLGGLNKRQNRQLLKHLGAEERLWAKVPTADLLDDRPGQSDETELGVSYEVIDDYLEGRVVPDAAAEKIEAAYLGSRHKRTTPVSILDDWWKNTDA